MADTPKEIVKASEPKDEGKKPTAAEQRAAEERAEAAAARDRAAYQEQVDALAAKAAQAAFAKSQWDS